MADNLKIYMYSSPIPKLDGWIKIGQTHKSDVNIRIQGQLISIPKGVEHYKLLFSDDAIRDDGTTFTDKDIHRLLIKNGVMVSGEWAKCDLDTAKSAFIAVKTNDDSNFGSYSDFKPRAEQIECIKKTKEYFSNKSNNNKFLWNAKMRFGKTYTAYKLAKEMNLKKILVTTFMPAVEDSWYKDIKHIDFKDWKFISKDDPESKKNELLSNKEATVVCFISLQDLLGKDSEEQIKIKNKIIHDTKWDLVIFDEYHFGAWRDKTQSIMNDSTDDEDAFEKCDVLNNDIEERNEVLINNEIEAKVFSIETKYKLYLSGTPYRSIRNGEFIENQIFSWTYEDEQKAKSEWDYSNGDNPYEELPEMNVFTYRLPTSIGEYIEVSGNDEFSLNEFFKAEFKNKKWEFKYKVYVQKWLETLINKLTPLTKKDLDKGLPQPLMPFSNGSFKDTEWKLKDELSHTFWLLPNISSCEAMYEILNEKVNRDSYYGQFKLVRAYGKYCGNGKNALVPVREAIMQSGKTITLSCGKLTTGVTIPEWNGIFMLFQSDKQEKYMQAAFRVQSPFYIKNPDGTKTIKKQRCYVFDFAPNRTLLQIKDYAVELDRHSGRTPTKQIENFLKFLPVIAFDGSQMIPLNPEELVTMALTGTSGSLLANRFKSYRLIDLSLPVLNEIANNPKVQEILAKIDVFRKTGEELETVINRAEKINELKTKEDLGSINKSEKKELSEEQKKQKKTISVAKEKLLTFISKIPLFMYINFFREETLEHVIEYIEPKLFEKVTGLTDSDFKLLKNINLFDELAMNETVLLFRVYEDYSLQYVGIERQANKKWSLWNETLTDNDREILKAQLKKN